MTGQLIGYADNTGFSADDHLHFEVKRLNADGSNANQDNGCFCAEDPAPLMFDEFVPNVNKVRLAIEKLALRVEALIDRMRAVKTSA